ncbi:MAG: aminoacyl-tRNA hydrolase [Candidatus Gracilibacteria bacterium]|jgi:PTH1 family peptidyl-tRNA hydrolase
MKILIGLGNPGQEYVKTRHNVGFMVMDLVMEEFGFDAFVLKSKLKAYISEGVVGGERIVLVKPDTFMNKSGEAVNAVKSFYKVDFPDLLVCYDDYDLPVGEIRFRENGSAGTHNGMKSCVELLGTQDIPRLRIGINSGIQVEDLSSYVLGRFSVEDMEKIKPVLHAAVEKVKNLLAI